jgi:hypothetical protein
MARYGGADGVPTDGDAGGRSSHGTRHGSRRQRHDSLHALQPHHRRRTRRFERAGVVSAVHLSRSWRDRRARATRRTRRVHRARAHGRHAHSRPPRARPAEPVPCAVGVRGPEPRCGHARHSGGAGEHVVGAGAVHPAPLGRGHRVEGPRVAPVDHVVAHLREGRGARRRRRHGARARSNGHHRLEPRWPTARHGRPHSPRPRRGGRRRAGARRGAGGRRHSPRHRRTQGARPWRQRRAAGASHPLGARCQW